MQRLLTWSIFSLSQVGVALWGCLRIGLNHKIFPGHPELKIGIAFAKTGAALVNWNAAIILLSMCRLALTRLRATRFGEKTVLLDMNVEIHRISGLLFLLGSLLHAIAHFFNVINLGKLHAIYWAHPTLVTGMLLMVMYMILSIPAYSRYVKNKCYEAFQYSHYLAIPSMVLLLSHGLFCFLKNSEGRCAGSTTWMFVCVPLLLALLELGWSTFRAYRFSYISKTISHPSNVIEIQIRKPNFVFVPGQYVYLRIPAVSYFQWHPFTLTSAPEEDHISVHLRLVGDWTRAVAELLYGERMPETLGIHVDGPYGCASQDFQKYDRVICIGAGIGQTPFASILKSLWYIQQLRPYMNIVTNFLYRYRANRPLGRVRLHSIAFVGICRSSKVWSVHTMFLG